MGLGVRVREAPGKGASAPLRALPAAYRRSCREELLYLPQPRGRDGVHSACVLHEAALRTYWIPMQRHPLRFPWQLQAVLLKHKQLRQGLTTVAPALPGRLHGGDTEAQRNAARAQPHRQHAGTGGQHTQVQRARQPAIGTVCGERSLECGWWRTMGRAGWKGHDFVFGAFLVDKWGPLGDNLARGAAVGWEVEVNG